MNECQNLVFITFTTLLIFFSHFFFLGFFDMSSSKAKTFFDILIWLPTGQRNAGAAVEWGLKRLRRGPPFSRRHFVSKPFSFSKHKYASYYVTKVSLTIVSLKYEFIANNCIKATIHTARPITLNQLRNIIRSEIKGPYIRAITEETPMVMF